MENTLKLYVSTSWKQVSERVQNELDYIVINGQPDTDVETSFGKVHINPKGSVSVLSFNGLDIPNNDYDFFAAQIYQPKLKYKNKVDLRKHINDHINDFIFYPIHDESETKMAILKYSKYFINNYPVDKITNVEYTFKAMLITFTYDNGTSEVYYFRCDFEDQFKLSFKLMKNSMDNTIKGDLYLCGFGRNEDFAVIMTGQYKEDFKVYEKYIRVANLQFYQTCILYWLTYLIKQTNNDQQLKYRTVISFLIKLMYDNDRKFAKTFNLNVSSFKDYFNGKTTNIIKESKAKLTDVDLLKYLQIDEDIMKLLASNNLLTPIKYDDIPERAY